MHVGYWWENEKERDHWENQLLGGWAILKWILERQNGMVWTGLMWLRIGTEHGNEPLGSIKCWGVIKLLVHWSSG
jgi:hypothetical protein